MVRTTTILALALLGACRPCRPPCAWCPTPTPVPAAPDTRAAPQDVVEIALSTAGRSEDDPGFLVVQGPDRLVAYHLSADIREANIESLRSRFVALHSARPNARVRVTYETAGETAAPTTDVAEVEAGLRAAGFREVTLIHRAPPHEETPRSTAAEPAEPPEVVLELRDGHFVLDGEDLGPVDGATAEEHQRTFDVLRAKLLARTADPSTREPDGTSRLVVRMRAPRPARWALTQPVIKICADPAIRIYRILFSVTRADGPR